MEARKLGDRLIVSVTSDRFVNKGPGRPRFTEAERAEALSALSCVDEVKINDSADAVPMIEHVKPAFYVKGIDYAEIKNNNDALNREMAAVNAAGGEIIFTSTHKWSSTELLEDRDPYEDYLDVLPKVECDASFAEVLALLSGLRGTGFRLFFVGNGGSATVAAHMAADWQKAGKIPAMCFNEAAAITAISNDVSYDMVFADQLRMHRQSGDILIAISSSGQSPNIHEAVNVARDGGMKVVTLSGFRPDNPLRIAGDVNFYVPSRSYGVVETSHLAILHSLLDASVDALR